MQIQVVIGLCLGILFVFIFYSMMQNIKCLHNLKKDNVSIKDTIYMNKDVDWILKVEHTPKHKVLFSKTNQIFLIVLKVFVLIVILAIVVFILLFKMTDYGSLLNVKIR